MLSSPSSSACLVLLERRNYRHRKIVLLPTFNAIPTLHSTSLPAVQEDLAADYGSPSTSATAQNLTLTKMRTLIMWHRVGGMCWLGGWTSSRVGTRLHLPSGLDVLLSQGDPLNMSFHSSTYCISPHTHYYMD